VVCSEMKCSISGDIEGYVLILAREALRTAAPVAMPKRNPDTRTS